MLFKIKSKLTGEVIFSAETEDLKSCVELAVKHQVNLENAELSYANLNGANLKEAKLSYADLRYADLRNSDLRNADLSYSGLGGAKLKGARHEGINLNKVNLALYHLGSGSIRFTDFEGSYLLDVNGEKIYLPE